MSQERRYTEKEINDAIESLAACIFAVEEEGLTLDADQVKYMAMAARVTLDRLMTEIRFLQHELCVGELDSVDCGGAQ